MGKHKNRQFDKKNAQRFRLVPGGGDPFAGNAHNASLDDVILDETTRKAEQVKYGILYDDDYNYMQHMKSSSEVPKLELIRYRIGSDQLESNASQNSVCDRQPVSDDTLSDAVSDADIDEVDRCLEEELEMDATGELDDDFIVQANCGVLPQLEQHGLVSHSVKDEEDEDVMDMLDDDESSSSEEDECHNFQLDYGSHGLSKQNTQRSVLDERLAKILEGYDDDDIGALDEEEIRGGSLQPDDDLFKQAEEDFEKRRKVNKKKTTCLSLIPESTSATSESNRQNIDDDEENYYSDDAGNTPNSAEEHEELEKIRISVKPKATQMYNCESILSIMSSCIPSHCPKMITEQSNRKSRKSSSSQLDNDIPSEKKIPSVLDDSEDTTSLTYIRRRDETTEERKARKAEVREIKKERREQKKALKTVFGREKCTVERQLASTLAAVRLA